MNSDLIIGLLTTTVILLSVIILALLTVIIIVLAKVKKVVNDVHQITGNVASITSWFTPAKVFSQARNLFKH